MWTGLAVALLLLLELFEIALVLVGLDHIAGLVVKHGQLFVAPRNEIEHAREIK